MNPEVWQIGTLIISALVGVIGILWKLLQAHNKDRLDRLKKYEEKEQVFNERMTEVSSKVARLEGERFGQNKGIEQIVKAVTEEIRFSRQEAYDAGVLKQSERK